LKRCLKHWQKLKALSSWLMQRTTLSSSSVVGHASVFVPMKGLIDPKAELGRLQKTWIKQKQHDQIANKLANEGFVSKAPAAVVEGEKAKLAEFAAQLDKVKANMEQIAALSFLVE
jgi:valyl-tRNA synthetase